MTHTTMPSTCITTYDAVGLPNQKTAVNGSEQKYNVLNRGQQQGSRYKKFYIHCRFLRLTIIHRNDCCQGEGWRGNRRESAGLNFQPFFIIQDVIMVKKQRLIAQKAIADQISNITTVSCTREKEERVGRSVCTTSWRNLREMTMKIQTKREQVMEQQSTRYRSLSKKCDTTTELHSPTLEQ